MDHASYIVSSEQISPLTKLQDDWQGLQDQSDCSYFQSWGWVSCWLQEIGFEKNVILLKVHNNDVLIGLGLFVVGEVSRRKIISSKVLFLNEYPIADNDMVMEYNGLLAAKGSEQQVYQQTLVYLDKHFPLVEEFNFGALSQQPSYSSLKSCELEGLKLIEHVKSPSWQVSLKKLNSGVDAYLGSLSKNTRAQIRYSKKHYEKNSPVTLEVANNVEQALQYFDALKALHIKHWQGRDKRHAFTDGKWEIFQRCMIEQRFNAGEIQLMKISNEQQDIAYLFNYVWRKRVYVLQMGFNYNEHSRVKPGYFAHALAIVYNRDAEMQVYDFMHGYSRYKKSMSDLSEELTWAVFQRPRLKFRFERLATNFIRRIKRIS